MSSTFPPFLIPSHADQRKEIETFLEDVVDVVEDTRDVEVIICKNRGPTEKEYGM